MATPEDQIAQELRDELEARIRGWQAEVERLQAAPARIAQLQALITEAQKDTGTVKIASRPVNPRGNR